MSTGHNVEIRTVRREDCGALLALMREFAEYVNMLDSLVVDRQKLEAELFDNWSAGALVAVIDHQVIGYAFYCAIFSSFSGQRGYYLDDLYISASHRKKGYGRALLEAVAEKTVRDGYAYLEWRCQDWNLAAIRFYRSLGASEYDSSKVFKLKESKLHDFAGFLPDGEGMKVPKALS